MKYIITALKILIDIFSKPEKNIFQKITKLKTLNKSIPWSQKKNKT